MLASDKTIIGNNAYTDNVEEFSKLGGYKEYFKENASRLGFPAAITVRELPWKGEEADRPFGARCMALQFWSEELSVKY